MDKFAKMELPKEKKEVIEKCRTYFNNNIDKMRYVDCCCVSSPNVISVSNKMTKFDSGQS
jgi:hypothetical protein